ncbi:MAG: DNA repair protein RecO [Cytophagaceae bacterium]|jgi:DNA repair protein RecO (recombination protein O)|nr:DNA repair protein RecO [Cytophagaceae bacterium]
MKYKTKAIVFSYIKYSDTSIIARIYTEVFGLQSYIIPGVRKSSNGTKMALFQPLTLLDLVVYHKEQSSLQRIAEMRCAEPYHHIPFDIYKSSIALFLTEMMQKSIKEEVSNRSLFEFLYHSLHALDEVSSEAAKNFHVMFLIRLAAYIGFYPASLEELWKTAAVPAAATQSYIQACIENNYFQSVHSTNTIRRETIQLLLHFYRTHIDGFGESNALPILQEVLS